MSNHAWLSARLSRVDRSTIAHLSKLQSIDCPIDRRSDLLALRIRALSRFR